MGKIVIHAGMPKTGSSSIQDWMRQEGARLHAEAGVTPLRAKVREGEVRLLVNDDRRLANAGKVYALYEERPERRREIVADFLSRLDRKATAHGTVVISAERFADWFWRREADFAGELDRLAGDHELVVAYYVRPQHTALEAAWRQWGFRRQAPPSEFLEQRSAQLDYLDTLLFMREAAPAVSFVPRPFRRDLLAGGNVVVDFARTFLGLDPEPAGEAEMWRNQGLPLELVNVLHGAPDGLLWPEDVPERVNPVLDRLREFVAELDLPGPEEGLRLSRLVLQQACHERFEPSNLRLVAELGWEAEDWVPALDPAAAAEVGEASFERLDELWRPRANDAELALIRAALAEMVAAERPAPDPAAV